MVTALVGPGSGRFASASACEVITLTSGPDEWAILCPSPGADSRLVERTAVAFLSDFGRPPAGPVEFRSAPMTNPLLGLAMLHATASGTAVYCRREGLGTEAASGLSAIARRSTLILLGSADTNNPPRTRVAVISHARWVGGQRADATPHPVVARVAGYASPPETTVFACSCQMSPELGVVLTALGCAQLQHLHQRRRARARLLRLTT